MDAKSGQVIYSYNPDVCLPMASTTKIMTAMLVLENTDLNDIVVVSDNAVRTIGTRVYLEPGESQTVENLLYAALLNSANDAAIALGEYLGKGSIDTFTAMMNQRALSLGAINTNFTNTTGLTEVNHFSTARDMALISREAMLNPKFREIVATRTYPWMGDKYQSSLVNLNRLLWTYPGITGIKTGYTSAAKNCLIASVQRDGHELISVILGSSSDIWKQSATLLDYGFECFVPTLLVNEGQIVTNVDISKQLRVPLLASRALQVSLPLGREDVRPQPQISVDSDIKLPLAAGTRIGQVTYEIEGQPLEPIPLIIAQDIPKEKSRLTMGVAGFSLIIVLLILRRILIHFRRLNYRRNRRNKRVQVIYRGQNPTFLAKKR
jgi:D-alanyl-D-alanine carboxypeptidase (penicillin-binding protein 5/6)